MRIYTSVVLATCFNLATAATTGDWRSRSIYQIVTDRFARTDGSTTATCDTEDRQYCGGTYQGVIDHLDYIQGMGFNALWISPITYQVEGETGYGEAFHGYWQQDLYRLNPHFGSEDDLKSLATELHKRDMYLMVDVVVNHNAWNGSASGIDYSKFNPFNKQEYYHPVNWITDWSNQTDIEDGWLGDNTVPLADLDTQSSFVQQEYQSWISSLVSNYSVDGLRVDTVKHVQKDFWPGFNNASGVFNTGEVLNGDPSYVCPYQEVMDSILNYPIYYPLIDAFKSTSGSMSDLANQINSVKSACKDSTVLGSFSENQDNPRFASYTSDISLAKNIIAYTILADGIPIIYGGQEQHYAGGNDPANREAVWLAGYNTSSPLYTHVAQLNQVRNQAIYKNSTYLTYQSWPIYSDTTTIALRKGFDGNQIITVLSNLGSDGSTYTLSLGNTGYTNGQQLVEVLSCSNVTVDDDGNIPVSMGQGLPKVFYPASQISGSGICN
ncbi:hypothetical protein Plec18167_001843 [Paecilomyces lecythidis]|uniref:alpha-amylase n=1 Tax=Paecilomyces lecythidis TaxID=3004212 RepID=A0ABR3YA50_9EURO